VPKGFNMDTLTKRINDIPPDGGFWRASTRETFEEVGRELRRKGLSEDEVVEILTRLYFAASAEYGD
jgi:hypothetical protein